MPACAAMFLRGDVAPAREVVVVPIDRERERRKLYETMSAWTINAENFGLDPRESLLHAVAMDPRKGKTAAAPATLPTIAEAAQVFRSDTGQLCWELPQSGHGCFTVDTPRSKLFTGFVAGRCFTLGDVGLEIGPTERDWATVSLVCIDGKGFDQPGRILIAATGMVHNQGAELEHLHGDLVTLGNRWGTAPILCEGVKANILLPAPAGRVTLYGLDESGNRRTAIPTQSHQGRALLPLDAKHATVWYEAEIK
jgi:hypothetical protein